LQKACGTVVMAIKKDEKRLEANAGVKLKPIEHF
jgi:hypothetical protein